MTRSTAAQLTVAAVAALAGIGLFRLVPALLAPDPAPPPAPPSLEDDRREREELRHRAWQEAAPKVEACQAEIEAKLTPLVLAPVNAFFDSRAAGSKAFADHLLSFSSKWKFMKTRMDGGDDAYRAWVSGQVRDKLINFDELEKLLEYRIARYVQEMEALENELLLELERDLLARPEFSGIDFPTGEALQEAFAEKTARLARSVGRDFAYDVSGLVATEIAAIVVARVATRMLVSGGILSGGAALSAQTIGITIAAAIVIDAIVSTVMNWASGSKDEINNHLRDAIFALRTQIVWGDAEVEQDGLVWELRLLSRERARIRQQAIEELITEPTP